jgi:hypothetical protein
MRDRFPALLTLMLAACSAAPVRHGSARSPAARIAASPSASAVSVAPPPPATRPSDDEICAADPASVAASLPAIHPFTQATPSCTKDPFCDFVEQAPAGDTCFVATANIARAERESRGASAPLGAADPWDGSKKPLYLDRIDQHLHLTPAEHRLLRSNGFVVLDRLPYKSYSAAFHDIFQEQLPLYVSIDPILHAVFAGTEHALERVERKQLVPAMATLLRKLRATLRQSRSVYASETLSDLQLYVDVAWGLAELTDPAPVAPASTAMSSEPPQAWIGGPRDDSPASALVDKAQNAGALEEVELFGRPRMIDFSQFTPRGHYASGPFGTEISLQSYFKAMTWLSKLEFNLVSRSCRSSQPGEVPNPAETPREVRDALALADLVERSGAWAELRLFEDVYGSFAGRREDVSVPDLQRIMRENKFRHGDRGAPDRLKQAIGSGYKRTARVHFMPQNSPDLPVIATLIGPRIGPDVAPLTSLVHDSVQGRLDMSAADIAFVLGHDRAKRYLSSELATFAQLPAALDQARSRLREQARTGNDAYATWLRAVLALAQPPPPAAPSFMRKEAFADVRMNSALVGYGQVRHAFVLLAGQGYDSYGCEIPDGWVEPLPAVYDAMLAHVRGLRTRNKGWEGLERVLAMLQSIAQTEAAGRSLTEAQKRWLGMVAENIPKGGFADSGEPPKWTGWYFDMFDDREHGASRTSAFIADVFTLTNKGVVQYLGADGPRLGVFVVDAAGQPRAMVGPVAKGYEAQAPLNGRLDDAASYSVSSKTAQWRHGYAASPAPEPALGLQGEMVECRDGKKAHWRLVVRSERPLKGISITLLDHHADPLTSPLPIDPGPAWKVYSFDLPQEVASATFGVEAVHVHADLAAADAGSGAWDFSTSPSVFYGPEMEDTSALPVRPRGAGPFAIGAALPERQTGRAARHARHSEQNIAEPDPLNSSRPDPLNSSR